MDKNTKEQVLGGLKKTYKVVKESILNVYDKSLGQIAFSSHASVFYIIKNSELIKENKVFQGVYDKDNQCLLIKNNKKKSYKKYLRKGTIIKFEESDEKYEIEKVNFNDTYDYLLKINNHEIAIACYKIEILNI